MDLEPCNDFLGIHPYRREYMLACRFCPSFTYREWPKERRHFLCGGVSNNDGLVVRARIGPVLIHSTFRLLICTYSQPGSARISGPSFARYARG